MDTFIVFAFFSPGPLEICIIGGIALLLFGKRLPEVARSLGKGIVEFKKGVRGIEDEVERGTYTPPAESSYNSRPVADEPTEEVTAPKFDPPKFNPGEGES
jgi:sec-independent protein translocase protein TatA